MPDTSIKIIRPLCCQSVQRLQNLTNINKQNNAWT